MSVVSYTLSGDVSTEIQNYVIDEIDLKLYKQQVEELQTQFDSYNDKFNSDFKNLFKKELVNIKKALETPNTCRFENILHETKKRLDAFRNPIMFRQCVIFDATRYLLIDKLNEYKKILNERHVNDLDIFIDYILLYFVNWNIPNISIYFENFRNKVLENTSLYVYNYFQNYLEDQLDEFGKKYEGRMGIDVTPVCQVCKTCAY